jgi:hypothetical protein
MHILQMDITTAFLHGDLEEDIYIAQPKGYHQGDSTFSCKLHKSIYGLKQAGRQWNQKLKGVLVQFGFVPSSADPTLYVLHKAGQTAYLLTYVDDLLIVGQDLNLLHRIQAHIKAHFAATAMGPAKRFLGIEITRDSTAGTLTITQRRMILDIAERYGQLDARAVSTPLAPGTALTKLTDTSGYSEFPLAEVVGALMHVAVCTRPDIAYAVGMLGRHTATPDNTHYTAAMHIIRYLKSTANHGLTYHRGTASSPFAASAFCDSDYAGDIATRRSTTGYAILAAGALVTWSSKLQPTVAASTAEAEYIAAAAAAKEALWMRQLLTDMGWPQACLPVGCDNQAALALLNNPIIGTKTKHIDVAHHFTRERIERGELRYYYVPTHSNAADGLTKPLAVHVHRTCCQHMGLSA